MSFSIMPKRFKFFDLFEAQNQKLCTAAALLDDIFQDFSNYKERCNKINIVEAEGDHLSRKISRNLALTFITPLDREDIHEINMAQEDVLNIIKKVSMRVSLFSFRSVPRAAPELMTNLRLMIEETGKMLQVLHKHKHIESHVLNEKKTMAQCEVFLAIALEQVYKVSTTDPGIVLEVMKWTQILNRIERVMNCTDHLANVIEGVVLKNA
ncbi:conserved hypothetical protein [Desulfovibrionales bacterium]